MHSHGQQTATTGHASASVCQRAVIPAAAAPKPDAMCIHGQRGHDDQVGIAKGRRAKRLRIRLIRPLCHAGSLAGHAMQ